jgi:DNA-binding SARP family transcriptional activator
MISALVTVPKTSTFGAVTSLQVRLLGHVDVVIDGHVVDLPGRLQRAALAGLALSGPTPASATWLQDVTWGRSQPTDPAASLRVMMTRLRKLLGSSGHRVASQGNGYVFDLGVDELDVSMLTASIDRAADALATSRIRDALNYAERATSLVRSTPLGDVGDIVQLQGDVARLAEMSRRAQYLYAQCLMKSGQPEPAVTVLSRLMAQSPMDERVARDGAVALFRCDRQADALAVLRGLREALLTGLGISPSKATNEVEMAILRHDPLLVGPVALDRVTVAVQTIDGDNFDSSSADGGDVTIASAITATPSAGLESASVRGVEVAAPSREGIDPWLWTGHVVTAPVPFVGRRDTLHEFELAWERVVTGRGATVGITGDEGMGKSSTIARFVQTLTDPVTVLMGAGQPDDVGPYALWSQALSQLLERHDVVVSGLDFSALSQAVADGGAPNDSVDTMRLEQTRRQIFGDVVSVLGRLSASRPVIIVLDDLQWCDTASVSLLRYVMAAIADQRVMMILSWRPREVDGHHRLTDAMRDLALQRVNVHELGPLDLDELRQWVRSSLAPMSESDALMVSRAIASSTGGHPLFVSDVMHSLLANIDGPPSKADVLVAACPSVDVLVQRRLNEVEPAIVDTMSALAILGDDTSLVTLAALVGRPLATVASEVDSLVALGLVREVGPSRFSCANPTYRRSVSDRLGPARRAVMHAHALDVVSEAGASPASQAAHCLAAGPLVGRQRAGQILRSAGADALARTGFTEAARLLDAAVEVVPLDAQAWVLLADARWRTGQITSAKAAAVQAARLALESGDVASAAAALTIHATFGAQGANDETSLALIERASAMSTSATDVALLRAFELYHRAMWSEPAVNIASLRGDVERLDGDQLALSVRTELWWASGVARFADRDIETRDAIANRLIKAGRVAGSARYVGRGVRLRCLTALESQSAHQVALLLGQLIDVADEAGSWLYRSDAQRWAVASAMARGEWEEAALLIKDGELMSAGPLAGHVTPNAGGWWIARGLDRSDQALADFDALLPQGRTMFSPDHGFFGPAHALHMVLMIDVGEIDRARVRLSELAVEQLLAESSLRARPGLVGLLSDVADRLDDVTLARAVQPYAAHFAGHQLLLGWGEALLGSSDRCAAQLESVIVRSGSDAALLLVAQREAELGWHACADATLAAAERARRRS